MWSNALAYHDVSLAPRDRLAELDRIGSELSGRGPTLYPEFEEFGKHFLRDADPTGPSEALTLGPALPGGTVRFAFGVDLDALPLDYVQGFRTIVLRRGFMSSRPPAGWRRTSTGHFYEVWERDDSDVVEHVPLGQPRQPSAEPRCGRVRALARRAEAAGAELVAAPRPLAALMVPAALPHPPAWAVDGTDPVTLQPAGPGAGGRPRARASRRQLRPVGRGQLRPRRSRCSWTGAGSARRATRSTAAGRASTWRGSSSTPAGTRSESVRGGGNLEPGNGGGARLIGPLALTPADPTALPLETVAADDWRSLCGRSLDWIEAVRP